MTKTAIAACVDCKDSHYKFAHWGIIRELLLFSAYKLQTHTGAGFLNNSKKKKLQTIRKPKTDTNPEYAHVTFLYNYPFLSLQHGALITIERCE